eukprot:324654-Amphidinium_carterae.1
MALAAAWEMQDAGTLWTNTLSEVTPETVADEDGFDPIAVSEGDDEESDELTCLSESEPAALPASSSAASSSAAAPAAAEPTRPQPLTQGERLQWLRVVYGSFDSKAPV